MFDNLMVLMAGRVVYFGASGPQMVEYFTHFCGAREPTLGDNLAEWMMVRC